MLSEISIKNVVLIESINLQLAQGLIALTGETGAGKSILLDGLGMAIGARSDKNLVRKGEHKSICSARFFPPADHRVYKILSDADIETEPDEGILLRRIINATGGSKAYLNDMPISAKLLSQIGSCLIEIHGQHDGRGLMDISTHINLLDEFGGHEKLLTKCKKAWEELSASQKHLDNLLTKHENAIADKEFFTHAINEIDSLAPKEGEDEELANMRKVLQSSEQVLTELKQAQIALEQNSANEESLARALGGLERVFGKISQYSGKDDNQDSDNNAINTLGLAKSCLEKALIELEEAGRAISDAAQEFIFEPDELDRLEERLFALRAAARKYDCKVDDLAKKRGEFASELAGIENIDADLQKAEKRLQNAKNQYEKQADLLHKARNKCAKRLDQMVEAELPALKMQKARFRTKIEKTNPGPNGYDRVCFEIASNQGSEFGSLNKIASGGELSRIALAIKLSLATGEKNTAGKTMIFDEIDAGVGGAVADAVGKRLAKLAENGQVLVVTHSPQLAASASHQIMISKTAKGQSTITNIKPLAANEREEEIARMLSGEKITDEARAAARKLMQG